MKDTVIKGTGTSRKLKAPATMPETFDEWRSQLLAGTATVDISLNPAGCDVVGTALSKETLLKDATKTALERRFLGGLSLLTAIRFIQSEWLCPFRTRV